jgi:hypothetical protein
MDRELWEERCWDRREASVFEGAVCCVSFAIVIGTKSRASYLVRA